MTEQFITLAEVIHQMDSGSRFDMEVVTADVNRGTGGELKAYANCIVRKAPGNAIVRVAAPNPSRSPNHYRNSTRNIYQLSDRRTIKVHLRLITRFNGLRVL